MWAAAAAVGGCVWCVHLPAACGIVIDSWRQEVGVVREVSSAGE